MSGICGFCNRPFDDPCCWHDRPMFQPKTPDAHWVFLWTQLADAYDSAMLNQQAMFLWGNSQATMMKAFAGEDRDEAAALFDSLIEENSAAYEKSSRRRIAARCRAIEAHKRMVTG